MMTHFLFRIIRCLLLIASLARAWVRVRQVPKSLKIEMTDRDRGRVRKMLEREAFSTPARAFWRKELQELLTSDCKYEIESLNAVNRSGSDPLGCDTPGVCSRCP
jgi:hypothetical protein